MDVRNPRYNEFGTIDLEINHPTFGWISYTSAPVDSNETCFELFKLASAGQFGEVLPYAPPQKTPEELLLEAKAERQRQVDAIQVTTSSGKTFDGDELSQGRMSRAAVVMGEEDTLPWVLADNSIAVVTKAELVEALRIAGAVMAQIWVGIYQKSA